MVLIGLICFMRSGFLLINLLEIRVLMLMEISLDEGLIGWMILDGGE